MPGRRDFLRGALAGGALSITGGALSLTGGSLTVGASSAEAQVPPAPSPADPRAAVVAMLREAVGLGRRLRRGELSPTGWQEGIGPVFGRCSVEQIWEGLGVEQIWRRAGSVQRGATILQVPLFDELGADEGADVKLFFFEAGRTDPPHVHFNMVAAHIVLAGEFRVRHYERLREEEGAFVIRPSHDRRITVGQHTTISDERDNSHWHAAVTRGVLLDVQQGRLDPSLPVRRREMIDPERGRRLADGSILAPRLSRGLALRRFG